MKLREFFRGYWKNLLILIVLILGAALWPELSRHLPEFNREGIISYLRRFGSLGPLAVVMLQVIQAIVFPFPSFVITVSSSAIFGVWLGFWLNYIGIAIGATICFYIARLLGRPAVSWLVGKQNLRRTDAFFLGKGLWPAFWMIVLVRGLSVIPFDPVSYGIGLLDYPYSYFIIASMLGEIPKVLGFAIVGDTFAEHEQMVGIVVAVFAFIMLIFTPLTLRWYFKGERRQGAPDGNAGSDLND